MHDIDLINYFFGDKIKVKNVNYSTNKMSYIEMESQNMPILFKFRKLNSNHWSEGISIIFEKGLVEIELKPAFLQNTSSTVKINKMSSGGLVNESSYNNFSFNWCFKNQHLDFIRSIQNPKYDPISSCSKTLNLYMLIDQIFKKI